MDIISYTAQQAMEDGILHEVPLFFSLSAGFRVPVRITRGVHLLLTSDDANDAQTDIRRLQQVLRVAYHAVRKEDESVVAFQVTLGDRTEKLWIGLDGTSGMALHIFLPEEY